MLRLNVTFYYRRSDRNPLPTIGPIKHLRNANQTKCAIPFDEGFRCTISDSPKLIRSPIQKNV